MTKKTNRTDVNNLIDSVNMMLRDYGIKFDFNGQDDLICVADGVEQLLTEAKACESLRVITKISRLITPKSYEYADVCADTLAEIEDTLRKMKAQI